MRVVMGITKAVFCVSGWGMRVVMGITKAVFCV